MIEITVKRPWLIGDLTERCRVLTWSIITPGFSLADRVVWREVSNDDLPINRDPRSWLTEQLEVNGFYPSIALMTSRDITRYHFSKYQIAGHKACCLATVGLSNAERVARRRRDRTIYGTVNLLVKVSKCLTDAALIEALSIIVQARTTAIIDADIKIAGSTEIATGTGTCCVVIACPERGEMLSYAGLHTPIGEALGVVVLDAMTKGIAKWREDYLSTN